MPNFRNSRFFCPIVYDHLMSGNQQMISEAIAHDTGADESGCFHGGHYIPERRKEANRRSLGRLRTGLLRSMLSAWRYFYIPSALPGK